MPSHYPLFPNQMVNKTAFLNEIYVKPKRRSDRDLFWATLALFGGLLLAIVL